MADSTRIEPPEGVRMEYVGHCAFRFTTPGGSRIVVDPFRNWPDGRRWFLRPSTSVEADVLLVSHPHADHDAVDTVAGEPRRLEDAGELRGEDFSVRGLRGRHSARMGGDIKYFNTIFVLETAGLRVCLMGDNEADLAEGLMRDIGPIDLLTVPVEDAGIILSAAAAERLADRLQPRVVVPTHYFIEGLTDPRSGFKRIDDWRGRQARLRDLEEATLDLRREDLPEEREGWVFGSCLALERLRRP